MDWGRILPPGLTAQVLASDLMIAGSALPNSSLGNVGIVVLPEPTGWQLLICGALMFLTLRMRHANVPRSTA